MRYRVWTLGITGVGFLISIAIVGSVFAAASPASQVLQITPTAGIANSEQLATAEAEWLASAHSETYDQGMGANTTCARCKSPLNWDPEAPATGQELNCFACKRIPGSQRPDLSQGVPVAEQNWEHISCEICHEPVDDSYRTSISFWDQRAGEYVPLEHTDELCEKCHEGRHGFEVYEEQGMSAVHTAWECVACHGSHGAPVACADCHDPSIGTGAQDHAQHLAVNCTACHDAGDLSIWRDPYPDSKRYNKVIPQRFAHTLTSWPSHNLQLEVECERCHHPRTALKGSVASEIGCEACHPGGVVLFWCVEEFHLRDGDPNATASSP